MIEKKRELHRSYFSYVGSYEGAVKVNGKWVRVKNLNYIDKTGWNRHNGPATRAIENALKSSTVMDARDLVEILDR